MDLPPDLLLRNDAQWRVSACPSKHRRVTLRDSNHHRQQKRIINNEFIFIARTWGDFSG